MFIPYLLLKIAVFGQKKFEWSGAAQGGRGRKTKKESLMMIAQLVAQMSRVVHTFKQWRTICLRNCLNDRYSKAWTA